MATPRKPRDTATEFDGDTGLPILTALPPGTGQPGGNAPDTDATRKTEEVYWHLLGEDKEGTGYVLVTYLENGQNNRETRVMQVPADLYGYEELLTVVQRDFAPQLHAGRTGQYRIRLYVHDGRQHVCRGNKLESIAATTKNTLPAIIPTGTGTDPALAAILAQLAQGQNQLAAAIADLSRPRESQVMAILKDTSALWVPVVAAGLVEYIKRPKDDGMKAFERMLTITKTVKELREDNEDGPEETANPWAGVAMKVLDGVTTMMQAGAMRVPQAPAITAAPAPGASAPPPGMPNHPLYAQVVNLLSVAADGADPDETAEALWAQLPENYKGPLVQFLDRKEAMRELTMIHPGVLDWLEWTVDFRAAVLDIAKGNVQDSGQVHDARPDNDGGSDHPDANP